MTTNDYDQIHRQLFDKVNTNTVAVERLTAKVDVLTEQNKNFLAIIKWVIGLMFITLSILIFAVVYGALGKDGMKAVRSAVPVISAHMDGAEDLAAFLKHSRG